MKLLSDGSGGSGGGSCCKLNGGSNGGGDKLPLLLLFPSFLSLFSLFCMIRSILSSCGAFLIRSLAVSVLSISSSCNSKPTVGISA